VKSLKKQIKRLLRRWAIEDKFTVRTGTNPRGKCVLLGSRGAATYSTHLLVFDMVQAATLILADHMKQAEITPEIPDLIISMVYDTESDDSVLSVERSTRRIMDEAT
jgi:hypothetical protein